MTAQALPDEPHVHLVSAGDADVDVRQFRLVGGLAGHVPAAPFALGADDALAICDRRNRRPGLDRGVWTATAAPPCAPRTTIPGAAPGIKTPHPPYRRSDTGHPGVSFTIHFPQNPGRSGQAGVDSARDCCGKGVAHHPVKRTCAALSAINAAAVLDDLRSPPGNRPEGIRGDRAGHHSIGIRDPWRIGFAWTDRGPAEAGTVEYRKRGRSCRG